MEPKIVRQELQLVGLTAMFIASKFEEMFAPEIHDFVFMSDKAYTKDDILEMEYRILKALDFNLGRPLPLHFLRRYTKVATAVSDDVTSPIFFISFIFCLVLVSYTSAVLNDAVFFRNRLTSFITPYLNISWN